MNWAEIGLDDLSIGEPRSPLNALLGQLSDDPEWWQPAHERALAASDRLLKAQDPWALEQATAELIGAELYDALREERSGLRFDLWATMLIGRAVDRIRDIADRDDDEWQGPWRLLLGLASIGSYGLGAFAADQTSEAASSVPRDQFAAQPSWLRLMPEIQATGTVRAMRDAYGTRFGVIAEFRYQADPDSSWYLLDIDACGLVRLAGTGVFSDADQAAAAWRGEVGDSAKGVKAGPMTAESLASLVYCEPEVDMVFGTESRAQLDNWFRGPRRIQDVLTVLREQGVDLPHYRSLYKDIDYAPMTEAFTAWYSARHGHAPGQEAAETLAEQWLEGMLPGTEHAVSPHRSQILRELVGDWLDDPVKDEVLALLPEWVRWNGEQGGIPEHLLSLAVATA